MTVEEVRGSLDLTDSGAIKNSIRNCLTVFQNDPYLQGAVRYNILTERIDIVKPLWWSKQTATLNDTDLNYLMLYLEDKYGLTSEKKIQKAISMDTVFQSPYLCQVRQTARMGTHPTVWQRAIGNRLKSARRFS